MPTKPSISTEAFLELTQGKTVDPLLQQLEQQTKRTFQPALVEHLGEPSPDELFRVENLTKSYGTGAAYREAVKGVSFAVHEGEYVVIVGPSGSGKSTLLTLLAGLEPPSRGAVSVQGSRLDGFTEEALAWYHRGVVGLVFQNFNLLDSLSVLDNVAFPLLLSGVSKVEREDRALELLESFGLAEFAGFSPNQLSGGQQQRVAMARALVHNPLLMLVDEPTGNLDSRSAQTVTKSLADLHKQGKTIILVTHSAEFLPYADRIFYLRDGTLLTSTAP